jgi:small-conductance mechanosensitive channel
MNIPADTPAAARCARGLALLLLSWPMLAGAALVQGTDTTGPALAAPGQATAPVRLDGRVIVVVRGVAGFTAAERAAAIESRVRDFARQRDVPVSVLQLVETQRGTEVRAGTVTLLTITDADAELEDIGRPVLAATALDVLARAVESWREDRSPQLLLRHAAYSIVATVLLALVLWLLLGGFHRLRALVRQRAGKHVRAVRVGPLELINAARLLQLVQVLTKLLFWAAILLLVYLYLEFVLSLFPWTRLLGARLLQLVTEPLSRLALSFVDALPDIVFLAVLVVVVRYVLKLTRMFFEAIEHRVLQFEGFDPEWAIPTYKVVRIFIVAFGVVIAYPYIPGSDSQAFKGVSVLLGVVFSLGSSSVIGNIIAGYTMTYRRAFRLGDRIRVEDIVGDVVESRVLVTTLRTAKNEMVVVPNSQILGSSVVNYSALAREQGLVLHTSVGIGYETPWRQVQAMLLMAAGRTAGLKQDPPPFVLQTGLGDFCVTYEVNAYTDSAARMPQLYSALHANILDVFNEYGVQIMTPNYESDPAAPKLVRPADWYAAPASAPPGAGPAGDGKD